MWDEFRMTVHPKRFGTVEIRSFVKRKDSTWDRIGTWNVNGVVWPWLKQMIVEGARATNVHLVIEVVPSLTHK